MAAAAEVVEVQLRCTPITADVITDTEHRVIVGVGAARSMKTQTGVVWAFRQWMLRGGEGTIAWFLGPELDRAFVLVEKFCNGEGDNPPVCPPILVRSFPRNKDAHDPTIEMIDGTKIMVKHMGSSGRNLTARGIVFGLATEMATAGSAMNFVRLRGRTVQSKGQIYLDAVPEPHNWVRTAILDAAIAEAEEIKEAIAAGVPANEATYRVVQLSQAVNVWVDEKESAAFARDLYRIDPRMAAREAGGEWVDDRDIWMPMFDPAIHTFDPLHLDPLEFLGLEDATGQASLRWFVEPKTHIVGADINARPHTALIAKIAVRKGERMNVPRLWRLVVLDVLQVYGKDSREAAGILSEYRGDAYKGAGVVIDSSSTNERHNAGGALNQRLNMTPLEAYRRAGFETRGPMRSSDPSKYTNPSRYDGSIVCRDIFRANRIHIDRRFCQPFIYALRNQMAEGDGVVAEKLENTVQDRKVAAFTDVLRYMAWPFFSMTPAQEQNSEIAVQVFG